MSSIKAAALTCLCFGAVLTQPVPGSAQSAADFYKGKQVSLIISTESGGGYDTYGRVLARHYGRYIPGNPSLVVQNMPGAGGIRATNHIYNSAAKDGTVLGLVHSAMTTASILTLPQVQFDTSRINWIGNMDEETAQCVSWHGSKIQTTKDMLEKPFVVGGSGAGSFLEIYPRVINNLLNAKIKVISGYKGGSEVALAMERGEVDGRCGWPMSSVRATRPDWVAEKKLVFLLQTGLTKDPALPDVPLITDFVTSADDKALLELIFVSRSILRPVFAPPDVPANRIAALRDAFMKTMADRTFVEEALKQGATITPMDGAKVQATIAKINQTPKAIVDRAVAAMGGCEGCPPPQ